MRHPLPVPGPGRAERRVHHLPLGDHLPARQAGDGEWHRGDPRDVHHRGGQADRQRHRGLQVSLGSDCRCLLLMLPSANPHNQELQLRRVVPVQGREQLQTHLCQREAKRDGRGLGAVRQHRHHHVSQVSHCP